MSTSCAELQRDIDSSPLLCCLPLDFRGTLSASSSWVCLFQCFFFLFAKEYAACHTLKFSEFIALAYMQITVNNNNIYNPINGKKQRFWRQFTHGTYSFTNEHNSCAVACALLLHFATPQLSSAACCSIADK